MITAKMKNNLEKGGKFEVEEKNQIICILTLDHDPLHSKPSTQALANTNILTKAQPIS